MDSERGHNPRPSADIPDESGGWRQSRVKALEKQRRAKRTALWHALLALLFFFAVILSVALRAAH